MRTGILPYHGTREKRKVFWKSTEWSFILARGRSRLVRVM